MKSKYRSSEHLACEFKLSINTNTSLDFEDLVWKKNIATSLIFYINFVSLHCCIQCIGHNIFLNGKANKYIIKLISPIKFSFIKMTIKSFKWSIQPGRFWIVYVWNFIGRSIANVRTKSASIEADWWVRGKRECGGPLLEGSGHWWLDQGWNIVCLNPSQE